MKRNSKGGSMVRVILFGVLLGIALAFGLAMLFAKLCEKEIISEKRIVLTALISMLFAVFISTLIAGRRANQMRFPTALCVGGIELAICILLHTLFLPGEFYHILWICISFALATAAGGLLAVQKKEKRKFA